MLFRSEKMAKREKMGGAGRRKRIDPHSQGSYLAEKSLNRFKEAVLKK